MLSFYWKVSSEPSEGLRHGDELSLRVCGVIVRSISGKTDWAKVSYYIDRRDGCFVEWKYIKNDFGRAGQDKGWVDDVTIVPMTPTPIAP